MNHTLVSIIIPNYNHASFLKERLDCVFNQTVKGFEVILLDDASTDNSVAVLNEYASKTQVSHFIINKKNSGSPFKQWKKGIELAKGNYIWIAESDDFCELDFLEKMMGLFNHNSDVGLGYCQTTDVDVSGKFLLNRINYTKEFTPNIWENDFVKSGEHFISEYLVNKNAIPNASAVVFKKELVLNTFFSDTLVNMKMCGDWFFWIQICENTSVGFVSEEMNYFRNHKAVSRNHSTLKIKKRRLLEESLIRSYLQIKNLSNLGTEQKLYNQWFQLHKVGSLFTASFYKVRLSKSTIFTFVTSFVKFKLSR